MNKKQKITIGSILEIPIDNYYCYAQILGKSGYAFFDFKTENPLKEYSILNEVPVLFILGVYDDVITGSHWIKVGKLFIRKELEKQPMQFVQDSINPEKFELYNPNTGDIIPTTKEECIGLECASVWEAEHVESRIRDYYAGVPNVWVEQLSIK